MANFNVVFKNTGESTSAEDGESLMDVTKKAGWPIAYGCEDGMCGTCLIKASKGLSKRTGKEDDTLKALGLDDSNYRLACQCKVEGDCEIEQ